MKHATDVLAEYFAMALIWLASAALIVVVVALCVRIAIDLRRWFKAGCP